MILVDTSVWVDHLRKGDTRLADLLERGAVLMHPFVLGEVACGTLSDRSTILALFAQLPSAPVADHDEALGYIERHRLYGRGIGYLDIHLLASSVLAGARLWTRDKRLHAVAAQQNLDFAQAT